MHTSNEQKKKLAIITTHPIQYNAPFFRKLAESKEVELKVFYTWNKGAGEKHDPGFGMNVEWDIPLLEGYEYTFVNNSSTDPGSHHYKGIICPALVDEITTYQPDAILIYGWNFDAHLKAMRYFKGKIPVWFRGDSTLLDYDYQSYKDIWIYLKRHPFSFQLSAFSSYLRFNLRRYYLISIYRHIDKAFYVGTHNKAYFLAHGLKEDQLVYMPHAVDNDFFSGDHEAREKDALEWRRTLGISDNDFVVLFAGKFEPKKNPELLMRAVIELNEELEHRDTDAKSKQRASVENTLSSSVLDFSEQNKTNSASNHRETAPPLKGEAGRGYHKIHLILVGNGILEQRLRQLAQNKRYIHFLPFQNQSRMPVVYRLGNVFCLPSQGPGETWGLAVNEALACNRRVIVSSKTGCAPDMVLNKNTGYAFISNDIGDLRKGIWVEYTTKITLNTFYSMALQMHTQNNQVQIILKTIR